MEILASVVGLLISGALRAIPFLRNSFNKLQRRQKVYVVVALAALWGAASLLGIEGGESLVDVVVEFLGAMSLAVAGSQAGYVMWGSGKEQA